MSKPQPLACNINALTEQERKTWSELVHSLRDAVARFRELDDGYQVSIDAKKLLRAQVEQLARLERKCCPFLSFQLKPDEGDERTVLDITGPPGVKEFLRMEFGIS